jgi:hypothetical protein
MNNNKSVSPMVIGCGGFLIVFACLVCLLLGYFASLRNEAIAKQEALAAQYGTNQTGYSEFNAGVQEQFGAILVSYQGLDKILTDAVKGRYDTDRDSEGHGSGVLAPNIFVKAISEAYPDLSKQTDLIGKLMDYIQSKRAGFKNGQDKLLDMLRNYDTWRKQTLQYFVLGIFGGTPTSDLEVRVGKTTYYGKDDTVQAFDTGEDKPFVPSNPFAEPTATTAR